EVKLMDKDDKHVFYDKLTFIYLEMPKFDKTEDELDGMLDKWFFVLKNLTRLFDRPAALQEQVFKKLFEQAEIARFTPEEVLEYEDSVKIYRDLKNSIDTSFSKGKMEGIAEGRVEGKKETNIVNARKMKAKGYPIDDIADITGLSKEEIVRL
ncbi:MAG: Rpn family recombination-promoting nuclease/putative transposase, partial [bacterium]|nr:Rpn family recombination-promoting nuclease/putative transposase [Candidatus Limimorpha equi]